MATRESEKVTTRKAEATGKKKTAEKSGSKETRAMSAGIKKAYLKSGKVCKVTFRLPHVAATNAKSVCIVGDFNGWSIHANAMKKLRNGDYTITLELKPGREYQFRYLIDECRWENDWNADKYVKSPYGDSDNSVIVT